MPGRAAVCSLGARALRHCRRPASRVTARWKHVCFLLRWRAGRARAFQSESVALLPNMWLFSLLGASCRAPGFALDFGAATVDPSAI